MILSILQKTVEEAVEMYRQITVICGGAGWKVHKWASNNRELLSHIPEADRAQGNKEAKDVSEEISVNTLGVKWLPETDEFIGAATEIDLNGKKISKRIVLKKIAKIFDPLGMMTPYVMQCKMILQEVWMSGTDWDENLEEDLRKRTLIWLSDLQYASSIHQQRVLMLNPEKIQQSELHCFTDASERAYGAVIYLKLVYEHEVVVKWVAAKGKVCPLESISIPRLELIAATLGAQMADKVRKALECKDIILRMWTDSMTVLWWITGRTRQLKLFVGNRVLEIHKYTNPSQWRHVPGDQNPADLVSRGCNLQELKASTLWKKGPEFIQKDMEHWPIQSRWKTKDSDKEIKKQYLERLVNYVSGENKAHSNMEEDDTESNNSSSSEEENSASDMIVQLQRKEQLRKFNIRKDITFSRSEDEGKIQLCNNIQHLQVDSEVNYLTPSRFSSLDKLVRVRAWVKRFVQNTGLPREARMTDFLKVWELAETEKEVVVEEQKKCFKTEYLALLKGKNIDAKSKLRELNPRLDEDGVMRVGGRIRQHPYMTWEMQCPIILPKSNHLTDLIISREHQYNHMFGTNYLMGKLKEKYWILSARSQIRAVTRRCMRCKKLKYSVMNQQLGLLPATRTQLTLKAFVNVGVDMAGPLMVKMGRGKSQQKRWICLFTCLSTRAVHLELCHSLDVSSFMNALTRLIGRRGVPQTLLSDNGSNFRGADNEMKRLFEMFKEEEFQGKCTQKKISWKFNPPGGPHHGGVFEAMIKSAKTALKDALFKKDLTDEELQTALISAEGMLNQRPLSYVGGEDDDFILTPNHFIHGSLGGMLAPEVLDSTPTFQKRWRFVQQILQDIWARWLREWVTELNKRRKWHKQHENVKTGDIVMIIEDNISKLRSDFPLARVTEVHTGPDGLVRSCKVNNADGRISTKIIQKLVKIESANDGMI